MTKKTLIYVICSVFLIEVFAEKTTIYLEHSETLSFDQERMPDCQILGGNVQFRHDNALMFCDSAFFHDKQNTIDAFGNIRIEQGDSIFVYGDKLHYEGNIKLAKLRHHVRMIKDGMTLYTDSLNYDRELNVGYYFNKGKINLIRGDRMPIGISPVEEESFKKHIIPFSEIDSFYIFSDGYPDQFGGPDNKKLKNAGFRELLKKINKISFAKQEKVLGKELGLWMGEEQQTDDILIIGIDLSSFK